MTTQSQEEGKLQQLIAKFGGWAGIALVTLACWTYQGDRSNVQQQIIQIEKSISSNSRSINRLQEGKLSKEEFKTAQENWIRETAGMREDIRDLTKIIQRQLER